MKLVTTDIESDGFVDDATKLWCAAAQEHGADLVRHWIFEEGVDLEYLDYLNSADVLIGHNIISHDLPLLKRLHGWEPRTNQKIVDTLLWSRLQKPDRRKPPHTPHGVGPHSVQAWGYRLGHHKVEHDEWDRFSPEMLTRCIEDVTIQVKIFDALTEEGRGMNWGPALRLTMHLFRLLREQEAAGFAVNQDLLTQSIAQLQRWVDRIDRVVTPRLPLIVEVEEGKVKGEYGYVKKPFKKDGSYSAITERFLARYVEPAKLANTVGYVDRDRFICGPFSRVAFRYTNLDSNIETKDFLLKQGWVPDQWNTNNNGARTSPKLSKDDRFIGVQGSLGKLIVRRVQCRQRKGILDGWRNTLEMTAQSRLPGIVTGLAVTGRARHKCIVNVPGTDAFYGAQMRKLFVVSPGRVLVGVDSKGNQIRQLAARMGDPEFTSVVLDPVKDIHSFNQERAGIPTRHAAKTFFYALIFGAGDAKISRQLGISLFEAKQLRKDFLGGMPAMVELLKRLEAEWKKNGGWIRGLDGRPIVVESEHQLLVYLLQSDEAIQLSHGYIEYYQELSNQFERDKWQFLLWMHDEYVVECEPDIANDVAKIGCWSIKYAGEKLGIPVPHEGSAKIGGSWFEVH